MKKKFLSMALTLCMILSLLPVTALAADPVEYVMQSWDEDKKAVVSQTMSENCTVVTSSSEHVTWSDGWYVVTGEGVEITGGVTVVGDVT